MKKFVVIIVCVTMLTVAAIFPCLAEEITETDVISEATAEAFTETGADTVAAPDSEISEDINETVNGEVTAEETQHTLFSRVWEYVCNNKTEMIGLAGDALIFALALFVKIRNDKKTRAIASDLKVVRGDASNTNAAQDSVVTSVNGMIEGYNAMRESYEKYESTEEDRNRLVGAVMVQNTALLEILTAVYINSKNLPQGVKDLVTIKYANAQKALGDDETLRAVVESVRERIGTDKQARNGDTEDKI